MASTVRKQKTPLKTTLLKEGYHFEFHQAVKILEMMYPDARPLGETTSPQEEVLKIQSRILLSYPSSDIFSIKLNEGFENSAEMQVNFMGLAGAIGPLPMPYTEKIIKRIQQKDTASRDFLDIFNHRILAILHRIRKKYTIGLTAIAPEKTTLAKALFCFMGLSTPSHKNRFHFADKTLLRFAGFFWGQQRTAHSLKILLESYFHIPVEIEQFVGSWQKISSSELTYLGRNGKNQILKKNAILGTEFWDQRGKIIIKLGPLTRVEFLKFIKTGRLYNSLNDLVRFYLGINQVFEINLIMKGKDILPSKLNGKTALSWTSWLRQKRTSQDDAQVIFTPEEEN
jgi:type VI secretion system protein ImpH